MSSGLQRLQDMCGRALEKFSKDLYASESHFICEILQNCDDNSYADTVVPTLTIRAEPELITLINNEKGFAAADVRSICDLGASTKINSQVDFLRD